MIRTQIYLSEQQRAHLARLAAQEGENVSELIRRAVENYLGEYEQGASARKKYAERIFAKAFGMWRDNKVDFAGIRKSADRTQK